MPLRKHQDGCGSKEAIRGPYKLAIPKWGADHPWLGHLDQGMMLKELKHSIDPGQ